MTFLEPALTSCRLPRTLIVLGAMALFSGAVLAEKAAFNGPYNVIFDTDLCLDDDDGMALAIVHALHDRHEANLVAVTVGLDEKWCASYADILNTFYGRPDVPIGTIRDGLSLKGAKEKIRNGLGLHQVKPELLSNTFVQLILKRRNPDGSPVYPHRLADGSQAPDAISLLRKTLAAHPDGSVVMIQVGNSTNFARLLGSRPDAISNLNGLDLIKRKVRLLSVMAGFFQYDKKQGGPATQKGGGINIYEDVESAKKIYDEWPTTIVTSGAEIAQIRIPGISVVQDFSYVENHPIAEAYRYMCAWLIQDGLIPPTTKCPHDHHTADLTATLYALRPDRNYFSLSSPGKITILPNGNTQFNEIQNGKHFHLAVNEEQKVRAQEAMMMLVSQPPVGLKH